MRKGVKRWADNMRSAPPPGDLTAAGPESGRLFTREGSHARESKPAPFL